MNIKRTILYSKKLLLFLVMILSYAVSSAAPVSQDIRADLNKETKKTFITAYEAHNFGEYYIAVNKENSLHIYENKHEEEYIVPKIKDFYINEGFEDYVEPYFEKLISYFYDIATDINRSLRS